MSDDGGPDDPFFDAVGRLVYWSGGMESMIRVTVAVTVPGKTMFDAEKMSPTKCLKKLDAVAAKLPEPEASELRAAIGDAQKVLDARNEVMHGIWARPADPEARISVRQHLTEKDPKGAPVIIRGRLTRERLLAERDRARDVFGVLQANSSRWADILDADTPPTNATRVREP